MIYSLPVSLSSDRECFDSLALQEFVNVYWRQVRNCVLNYEAGRERRNLADFPAVAYLDEALVLNVGQSSEGLLETGSTAAASSC